jgi:hypothetical protein
MYIVICQGKKHILIFVTEDQNTIYAFASKGTHVAYLDLILH